MSEVRYAILYDGGQETADNFDSPEAAVGWARRRGLSQFTLVTVAGPGGFYADYRTYRNGRPAADLGRRARRGCGRGFGYHQREGVK